MSGTELTSDPRTDLEIIEVPVEHMKYFAELKGAVIHWFGVFDKYSSNWRPESRIGIISDQCIYCCRPDGDIVRCLNIRFVQELILSEQMAIGFKVGAPERDLLIVLKTQPDRDVVATIIGKVYYNLVGHKLKTRTLSGDAADSLQQTIKLGKPQGWSLKVEPIRSVKSLTKMMVDKQRKEDEERRTIEMQFHKIEEGLRVELQSYRAEEHSRLVQQLSDYAKLLEKKEEEIARARETTISENDVERWRHCPICVELRRKMESNQSEEKQKILRLERQIVSQNHIVQHLQVAIQFRTQAAKEAAELGGTDEAKKAHVVLQGEIAGAQRKNRELQQLILESPHLTPDVKARAVRLAGDTSASVGTAGGASAGAGSGVAAAMQQSGGVAQQNDMLELISDKEREIRYLKQVVMDATQRQLQEMATVKKMLQKYDSQVIIYLERVFREKGQLSGVDARKLAEGAAVTAMRQAQAVAQLQDQQQHERDNAAALLPRGFRPAEASAMSPAGSGAAAGAAPASSPLGFTNSSGSRNGSSHGTPQANPLSSVGATPQSGSLTPRSAGMSVGRSVARSPMNLTLSR